jgi:GTPase SAR1 family protein
MSTAAATISIALLSHTNAGKTTLARTLLRRDIGSVMDRAHVTEVAEEYELMRSADGDRLLLWDTPGFGDSVRLQRRLAASAQPIGWLLSQVWDRFADRAFWCSQQALRAARDSADVVLYVVNATEDPAAAGYIEPELRILDWLGKPALLLLNQLGTRDDPAQDQSLVEQWGAFLRRQPVRGALRILSFDAFARCWVQEHVLLDAIADVLAEPQRSACVRVAAAWRARDLDVLERSAAVIAEQLGRLARDTEPLPDVTLAQKVGRALQGSADAALEATDERARNALTGRLDQSVRESTAALVALHGLTGTAGDQILQQVGAAYSTQRPPDADKAGLWGGLVSGALGGLAADLAAGGLTLGAGALLGGIAGAYGARKLTQHYRQERGLGGGSVRWSDEFLDARLAAAVIRYLAVAHFGRGRGEFQLGEPAPRWQAAVDASLAAVRARRLEAWAAARAGTGSEPPLQGLVHATLVETLSRLYPEPLAALRAYGSLTA